MTESQLCRILYVEDEPDLQEIVRLALESLGGFSVKVCSSGQEALEQAPAFGAQLILLDVMMPGMDGPQTLSGLRRLSETADTPVVFITAKVQPNEVARLRELGVADVIAKPFDPMTLPEQLERIWRQ